MDSKTNQNNSTDSQINLDNNQNNLSDNHDLKENANTTVVLAPQVISNLNDNYDHDEELLKEENQRFTVFPIKNESIWKLYKKQLEAFWKAEEIDFSNDKNDFMLLTKDEQTFVKFVLSFFAASDGIVNFNLRERFLKEVKIMEAQTAYGYQMMMENIHCVSAETQILTSNGYYKIFDLLDKSIKVWNGKEFTNTTVKYTGDSKLYRVTLSNGMELDCTPDHKWFIQTGNKKHPERCKIIKDETKNMKIGTIIAKYELPVVHMKDIDEFQNPYIHGFFCGDGAYCNNFPIVDLYGEKKKLLEYFNVEKYQNCEKEDKIRFYITKKINKDKFFVPINYSVDTKLRWLEGLCDSDGCINYNAKKTGTSIQITSINYDFFKNIQLMLTTLGINTNIKIASDERKTLLPDGKGGKKEYDCKKCYVIYITIDSVNKLVNLGFNPKRLLIKKDSICKNKPKLIQVINITELDGIHKTYCFNEPKENAGIFNGILTGQSEVYSLMLENIVDDKDEREMLFNAIQTVPSVKAMADWAFKWINSSSSFAFRLLAFAIVEGVFFSGAFAAIFWLKKYRSQGKHFMNGLIKSNEFISRDEGQHCISKGTMVTIDGFQSVPIEDLINNNNHNVMTYDQNSKTAGATYSKQINFASQGEKECIELTFEDGRTLTCTPDHLILTTKGWIEAGKLIKNNHKVLIAPENPSIKKTAKDIEQEKTWKFEIDEFKISTDTLENVKKACAFARILGYLATDGTIVKRNDSFHAQICVGHKLDVDSLSHDIMYVFGKHNKITFRNNMYCIDLGKTTATLLSKIEGITYGKRVIQKTYLPKFIKTAPRIIIANYLAGLFGGDGLAPSTKFVTNKKIALRHDLGFVFSKVESENENAIEYCNDLIQLLDKFDIKAKIQKKQKLPIKKDGLQKYKHIISINTNNVQKFYKQIGFAYCITKHIRLTVSASIINLSDKIKEQNDFIVNKFNELTNYTEINKEAVRLNYTGSKKTNYIINNMSDKMDNMRSSAINEWKINNPIYGQIKSSSSIRDNLTGKTIGTVPYIDEEELMKKWNVFSFFRDEKIVTDIQKDYIQSQSENNNNIDINKNKQITKTIYAVPHTRDTIPCIQMEVIQVKNVGIRETFDITVENTHNFIANGVVVHNCEFAFNLYKLLKHRLSKDIVFQIIDEAVKISIKFTDDALQTKLIGMNQDLMEQYIKYIADRLLVSMNYEKLYNEENPFDFMETIGMIRKTNFFETRPTEYKSAYSSENKIVKKFKVLDSY